MANFNTIISLNVSSAIDWLHQGECIGIPTETVYGLAANALNIKAVAKIFEIKARPKFDPLIIHSNSIEKVQEYVKEFPREAYKLSERFWPGPLTLLLPKNDKIPDLVTSGLPQVAVRVPNHPLSLELLSKIDFPLAAPSANPFGYISPTLPNHVFKQLQGKIPLILDGGKCSIGLESTIIGFENQSPVIYRLGGLAIEEIENTIGKVRIMPHSSSKPQSPGMLESHYAPQKPLYFNSLDYKKKFTPSEMGVIAFNELHPDFPEENQILLSPAGDLIEAATNLFATMRNLDESRVKAIFAYEFPNFQLGPAINDRLRRASVR